MGLNCSIVPTSVRCGLPVSAPRCRILSPDFYAIGNVARIVTITITKAASMRSTIGLTDINMPFLPSGLVFDRPQKLAIQLRFIPLSRNRHPFFRLCKKIRIIAANVKRVEPINDFAHERAHLIIVEV